MKPNQRLLATAYHEAGHAVMHWHLGRTIKVVTIHPEDGRPGACVVAKSFLRFKNGVLNTSVHCIPNIEKEIITLLAGPIAERTRHKSGFRIDYRDSDWHKAVDVALCVNGSGEIATAWLKWLELRTRAYVKLLWPRIVAVADSLMDTDTLFGAQVDAICLNAKSFRQLSPEQQDATWNEIYERVPGIPY